jgi:putative DNA primase/helicase
MTRSEIIAANPLPRFLAERGYELQRAGKNFVTNGCPVTEHKKGHRPVTLYTETASWNCHDCKRGGSVIDWVMLEKNVSAGDAMRELGGGKNGSEPQRPPRRLIAKTYDYTDENGELLFQCVRYFPKGFSQRRPDGNGNWIWGLTAGKYVQGKDGNWYKENDKTPPALPRKRFEAVETALYRLPEIIKLQSVCVAEGEKDADNLNSLGFTATTNPMGAGKWRDAEYSETLRGKDVIVFGDDDETGEKHTAEVIESLQGKAHSIKHVTLPDGFKDVSDYIASLPPDSAARSLRNLIAATPELEREKSWDDAISAAVVTSRELAGLALTPRKKLLGDWFCEGDLGFIFAFRGVGKTWLALAIAQALSTAGKLGDWKAQEPVKVLYVDGEMPPDLMRDRTQGLERGNAELEFLNHEILFERAGRVLNIANREVQQALTAHCIANNVKALILDNLSTLASGMKENEADSWEQLNPWLLDLRRRRIAVVIVHHAGRSGEMRGTSKREDNVFWIIALDDRKKDADDKRGARFISHFTKPSRNTQAEVPAFEWHFVTEQSGQVTISHKQAQTLDVFRGVIESGVTKTDEIAAAMKLPNYQVSRMAKKAMDEGWLEKAKRGEYAIKKEDE